MDWYRLLRRAQREHIASGFAPNDAFRLAAIKLGYWPRPAAPGFGVTEGSARVTSDGLSESVHRMLARWRDDETRAHQPEVRSPAERGGER